MKRIFGIKLGGLHQKILNLVLIFLLVTIGLGFGISMYQTSKLTKIVNETRENQQDALNTTSTKTIYQVVDASVTKTNALQAYIAEEMFLTVKKDVNSLRALAEGTFRNRDKLEGSSVALPDPATDGQITAQLLMEEGIDPTASKLLPYGALLSETMIAMYKTSNYSTNCYIGFADGTNICIDNIASNKYDDKGQLIPFPVRQRPWYTGAVEKGDVTFTQPMLDTYTGTICITCSAPIYVDSELIGVVGIDLFLSDMEKYVEDSAAKGSFLCVVDNEGKIVFAPKDNGLFEVKLTGEAEDLRNSESKSLAEVVSLSMTQSTGLKNVNIDGKDYYMVGSPLKTVGWSVLSVVDKSITEIPTKQMLDDFNSINDSARSDYSDGASHINTLTLIAIAAILIIGSGTALYTAGRIVKPVESMTEEIIEGGKTGKLFEMKNIYKTKDEIQVLAESFDDLSQKTVQYIKDITRITKEKERIGTELALARKIQADMVPNIYPAFPDRPEFDIFATMHPAKEVGGDFYDFFLIDSDHLGMVMADVSGKGVPAALFMMMSKILINNFAMMGGSPAQVLERTNNVICQNNEEEMFVTVWFGILEISTGRITAANAGHEYPIIKKPGGKFELFKDKHGFVLGGLEGMTFDEYEMNLEKGGSLYLYTDGVPEAMNDKDEMFGTKRLLDALNKYDNNITVKLLTDLKESIDAFVGNADQFDDLTMLVIKLRDDNETKEEE